MNYKVFISKQFWFSIDPSVLYKSDYAILILAGIFLVLAAISFILKLKIQNSYDKNILTKVSSAFLIVGLLEAIWFGFRYEHIAFFGTHFAAGIILLVFLIYLGFIFKDILKNRKALIQKWQKDQINSKYLPQQR